MPHIKVRIWNLVLVLIHPPDPARCAYGPISSTLHVEHFNGPGGCVVVVVIWVVGFSVFSAVVVVVEVAVAAADDWLGDVMINGGVVLKFSFPEPSLDSL